MPSVPSYTCFLFEKAPGKTRLLIGSRGPNSSLQSTDAISQTDQVLVLVRQATHRFPIFYCRAIHLLTRCDWSDDLSVRPTRRYL